MFYSSSSSRSSISLSTSLQNNNEKNISIKVIGLNIKRLQYYSTATGSKVSRSGLYTSMVLLDSKLIDIISRKVFPRLLSYGQFQASAHLVERISSDKEFHSPTTAILMPGISFEGRHPNMYIRKTDGTAFHFYIEPNQNTERETWDVVVAVYWENITNNTVYRTLLPAKN